MGVHGEGLLERHPTRHSEAVFDRCAPQHQDVDARVGRPVVAQRTGDPCGGVFSAPRFHPEADALFSAIDVLTGTGLLAATHVETWRKGRVDFLERVIQGNLKKISLSMAMFRHWALEKGLKPSETGYVRRARIGTVDLRFSKSGDPGIEKSYRTHYVSPALSETKQQRLQEKLNQSPKPVVFQNLREAQCSECGAEIEQDSLLSMELEQPLCLRCARLDDLEFLP